MLRLLFALILMLPGPAAGIDGILPATAFRVPFTVDGKPVANRAMVSIAADGKATLTVLYLKGDDIAEATYVLVRQDSPVPPAPPVPIPVPPVPIPVPVADLWGVVVEESAERTPQQAIVLTAPEVRDSLKQFRVLDKDTTVATDMQPYLDRAKGDVLPVLFLVDGSGKVHFEGPLPATLDAMKALIARWKGGGK